MWFLLYALTCIWWCRVIRHTVDWQIDKILPSFSSLEWLHKTYVDSLMSFRSADDILWQLAIHECCYKTTVYNCDWGCCNLWQPFKCRSNLNLVESRVPITYCSITKSFWHFAQSMIDHCRSLGKLLKHFVNLNEYSERTRFHEIRVCDEVDILNHNSPLATLSIRYIGTLVINTVMACSLSVSWHSFSTTLNGAGTWHTLFNGIFRLSD